MKTIDSLENSRGDEESLGGGLISTSSGRRRAGLSDDSYAAAAAAEAMGAAGALEAGRAPTLEVPHMCRGSTFTAAAHILTAVIGAGVLALPFSVAMLGWVAGPLCIVLFGALTQVCSVLLADCYIIDGKVNRTYSACVAACFGRWGEITIGIVQHVNLVLVTLAYAITAPQSLQTIARSICRQKGSNACFDDYNLWAVIFGGSQLIMSQLPDIEHLWLSSIIGAVMAFGYSFIAVGMSAAKASGGAQGTIAGVPCDSPADKAFQVANAVGALLFAFNFSVQLVEIQDTISLERQPGPVQSMRRAVGISVMIMTAIYLAVACTGYAAFGDGVPGSIMTAFTTPPWLVDLANAMVVVHLGPAYQICLQPTMMFLEAKMERWQRMPVWSKGWALRLWFRSACVALITFTAILAPFFGVIVGLSGALSFWPATVWFPVEMWLKVQQPPPRRRLALRALSAATLVVTLAAIVGSVQQVVVSWVTFDLFSGAQ